MTVPESAQSAAPTPLLSAARRLAAQLPLLYGCLCLVISLYAVTRGWANTPIDYHGFRQTQTALGARAILQGGPWLADETPVMGPPWSIPFEFPIYQWLVALCVKATGMGLTQAGRLVSVAFYYACLGPILWLLASLGVARANRWLPVAVFLLSPVYLFWSRTVMIETTALFFGLLYVAGGLAFLRDRKPGYLAVGTLSGCLCALVKVTTFVPAAVVLALFTLRELVAEYRRSGRLAWGLSVLVAAFLAAVPALLGVGWTAWADSLKMQNPLAAGFIDSGSLHAWNFGGDRLSLGFWRLVLARLDSTAGNGDLAACAALAGLVFLRKYRAAAVFLIIGFVSAFAVNQNLHDVHPYYVAANGAFALLALGLLPVELVEGYQRPVRAALLLLAMSGVGLWHYSHQDLPTAEVDHRGFDDLVQVVKDRVRPQDVVWIYGADWDSTIPFLIERRAVEDRQGLPIDSPKIHAVRTNLTTAGLQVGAVLLCGGERFSVGRYAEGIRELGTGRALTPPIQTQWCTVFSYQ